VFGCWSAAPCSNSRIGQKEWRVTSGERRVARDRWRVASWQSIHARPDQPGHRLRVGYCSQRRTSECCSRATLIAGVPQNSVAPMSQRDDEYLLLGEGTKAEPSSRSSLALLRAGASLLGVTGVSLRSGPIAG